MLELYGLANETHCICANIVFGWLRRWCSCRIRIWDQKECLRENSRMTLWIPVTRLWWISSDAAAMGHIARDGDHEGRWAFSWNGMAVERLDLMLGDRHFLHQFLHSIGALERFSIPGQGRVRPVELWKVAKACFRVVGLVVDANEAVRCPCGDFDARFEEFETS